MVVSFAKCLQLLCHVLVQYSHVLLQLLLSQRLKLIKEREKGARKSDDGDILIFISTHKDTMHMLALDYSSKWVNHPCRLMYYTCTKVDHAIPKMYTVRCIN